MSLHTAADVLRAVRDCIAQVTASGQSASGGKLQCSVYAGDEAIQRSPRGVTVHCKMPYRTPGQGITSKLWQIEVVLHIRVKSMKAGQSAEHLVTDGEAVIDALHTWQHSQDSVGIRSLQVTPSSIWEDQQTGHLLGEYFVTVGYQRS